MASLCQPAPAIGGLVLGGMALAAMGSGGTGWLPLLLVPVVLPMGVLIGCLISIGCTTWYIRFMVILLALAGLISARSGPQLLGGIAFLLTTIPPPVDSNTPLHG